MASSDKPKIVERDVKEKEDDKEGKGGFIEKVKDFIHGIEDERKLVSGLIPDAGTIHAHGSETVKIPVSLAYDDVKNTYDDIKPGSIIPYKVKFDVIVDVPVFGRLTLPLEKTGEIHIPYKPDIDLEKICFQRFSFEETVAVLHLKLENENDFDLGLKALEYEVWLSDVSEVQNFQNLLPLLKMVLVTLIFPSPSRLKTLDLLFGT
ncbi:late embryogenesis abundant protein, group 2 [Actinidia rufa]|uniref:Late embryogenesis abundant protein, group 2 n=1 Tax=Actinidia rufa TaxID=165716 RepID=A0A7J0DM84_9ERIC|nr:late embryogenesis abundant protein, group 2 [Actinidia rufa]